MKEVGGGGGRSRMKQRNRKRTEKGEGPRRCSGVEGVAHPSPYDGLWQAGVSRRQVEEGLQCGCLGPLVRRCSTRGGSYSGYNIYLETLFTTPPVIPLVVVEL